MAVLERHQDLVDELLAEVEGYKPDADRELLTRAFDFAARAHDGQLRRSGQEFIYHNAITARFDRRQMLLWTNPDDLSFVWLTTLDRKEGPYIVPLVERCAVTAEPNGAGIRRARLKIEETNAVKRAEYRAIEPLLARTKFRITLADRPTVALGEKMDASYVIAKRETASASRVLTRARQLARQTKLVSPDAISAERADSFSAGVKAMIEADQESTEKL